MITVHTTEPYVALKALNGSGKVLGTAKAIKLEGSAWSGLQEDHAPPVNRGYRHQVSGIRRV